MYQFFIVFLDFTNYLKQRIKTFFIMCSFQFHDAHFTSDVISIAVALTASEPLNDILNKTNWMRQTERVQVTFTVDLVLWSKIHTNCWLWLCEKSRCSDPRRNFKSNNSVIIEYRNQNLRLKMKRIIKWERIMKITKINLYWIGTYCIEIFFRTMRRAIDYYL